MNGQQRQHKEKDRRQSQGQGQGHGPVRSTDDVPDCLRRYQYHARRLKQQQRQQHGYNEHHQSPHHHHRPNKEPRVPPQPEPQPGRQHERHERRTPHQMQMQQQQHAPAAAPAPAPPPPPLPELPFRPTPGSYTCDLLLEARRSTPTPSELARSLRFAHRLLLGPTMGVVVPPPAHGSGETTTSGGQHGREGRGGGGGGLGGGPTTGPTEMTTSPPSGDVLSEVLALPQACFLTMLPHDPPRVVVAHSLGRYHPPSSLLGDTRDPYRNRIVAFVGERAGVSTPPSTVVRGGNNPHHLHGSDDPDEDDGGERLLDDVVAGGDDSSARGGGVPLPSLFLAPRASSSELFAPRKYSLIPRGALDRRYGDGGSCDDSEDDGDGDNRRRSVTDHDAETGGGGGGVTEEAYLTKLAYIPPSWAVHFLGGMSPYRALELATRLVSVSLGPTPRHRRAAEPLLRWLRLACQGDHPRRGGGFHGGARAASVDWAPVLDDGGGCGGGGVRSFAVRRMRFAMRATVAVAAGVSTVGSGVAGAGVGVAGPGRGPGTEELPAPPRLAPPLPRREMVVDDGDDGGDDAAGRCGEGSGGAMIAAADEEEGGGEDHPTPPPPPVPQHSLKRLRHILSGSTPPMKKRCRDEHEEGDDEDGVSYGRTMTAPQPPPSPRGASGVNLGRGAFGAHHGAENGGLESSTGAAAAAVRKRAPSTTRDGEVSERRHHHAPGGGGGGGGEGEGNDHRPSIASAASSSSAGGDKFSAILTAAAATAIPAAPPSLPPPPQPRVLDRHHAPPPSAAAPRRVSAEDVGGIAIGVEVGASSPAGTSSSPSSSSSCSADRQREHREYPLHNVKNYHPHDVLCGRGGRTNHHVGNENWRNLVAANKCLYISLPRRQKMMVAQSIVKVVRAQNPPGRFLQRNPDTGLYSDIGDQKAHDKTSQALREGAVDVREVMRSENKHLGMHVAPGGNPAFNTMTNYMALNMMNVNNVNNVGHHIGAQSAQSQGAPPNPNTPPLIPPWQPPRRSTTSSDQQA